MLHDGQQLDVRVAHLLDVLHQLDGQLAIAERLPLRAAHPGFQVHFVDGDRRFQPVGACARASIQAASCHWYLSMFHTTEADFGGVSQ